MVPGWNGDSLPDSTNLAQGGSRGGDRRSEGNGLNNSLSKPQGSNISVSYCLYRHRMSPNLGSPQAGRISPYSMDEETEAPSYEPRITQSNL